VPGLSLVKSGVSVVSVDVKHIKQE